MKKTVAFHNLGCKVNAYELEAMQQILEKAGYQIVPFEPGADVYIINTCTVTNIADRKSRQMLHKAKKMNPNAVVVAVGCYVQADLPRLEADEAVDLIVGNNRKKDIVSLLEAYDKTRDRQECVININQTKEYEPLRIDSTAEHVRAYIKVQDGCNQFCTYCIIPYARGRVRSRRLEDVRAEVEKLAAAGYQEVVLTGIHLSSYGLDFEKQLSGREESAKEECQRDYQTGNQGKNGRWLLELIRQVSQVEKIRRIRLGSLEPRIVTEEFARTLAANDKICPHFHLSLQSGSNSVLRRMNRHYTPQEYEECCENLRRAFRNPAITTDVIVGFPGETEEEFEETREFAKRIHFYEMHVFKYSRRAGTRAAVMAGQIPESVKGERSERLLELEAWMSLEYRKSLLGTVQEVLLEEEEELDGRKFIAGYTRQYVRTAIPMEKELRSGQILQVKMKELLNNETVVGEIVR